MFSPYNQTDLRYRDASSPINTEPMTLGSPVSSPKSPRNKAINQNYLPSYLFGDSVTSPISSPGWHTPSATTSKQLNQSGYHQTPSHLTTPITRYKEHSSFQSVGSSSSIIATPNPVKNGPPTQGLLFSTPSLNSFNPLQLDASASDRLAAESTSFSSVLTPSKSFCAGNTSCMSPAQIDPFYTQGEALKTGDQLDESWVTVFGFPTASASYILQQFSQYGNIVEHKRPTDGNWMHLKYQSKLQAKKALSKNGKVYSGNIMIAVKPCIEIDIMESCKENSVLQTSLLSDSTQAESSTQEPLKPDLRKIRPLTQAYQSPNTLVTNAKSGGIVSKALEYLWK